MARIPFSPPHIDDAIVEAVNEVLYSGWITTGPRTKAFEKELADYCGNPKTLCLSSGTAAMELFLHWYGIGEGDEVIVPAYTYCATANVVIRRGATLRLVDIDPADFNISVSAVEEAITERTKAIIPVDIGGWPAPYEAILELVRREDIRERFTPASAPQEVMERILVLADAAHSLGAVRHGKRAGTLADATAFSFHAVKNLTTAEGGALALNLPSPFDNETVYERLNVLSLHGQSKDALSKNAGSWRYDVVEAGFKCNMTDIQAAMGLVQLRRYEERIQAHRAAIFDRYSAHFEPFESFIRPPYRDGTARTGFHLYLLRIRGISEAQRDRIIERVIGEGIAVNVHFIPLPMLTAFRTMGYQMSDFPEAHDTYAREITLPVYQDLALEDVDRVAETVIEASRAEIAAL